MNTHSTTSTRTPVDISRLAEHTQGFCYVNCTSDTITELLDTLPINYFEDVIHIDDNSQLYTTSELKHGIETNQIILVEHSALAGDKQQQQFFAEFLSDYQHTIDNSPTCEHTLYIEHLQQLTPTNRFNYCELVSNPDSENLAVHVRDTPLDDLSESVGKAIQSV